MGSLSRASSLRQGLRLRNYRSVVGSALINPGYVQMSEDLKITIEQSSYCTTIFIVFSGLAPMFIVPYANTYGRRILFVVCFSQPLRMENS